MDLFDLREWQGLKELDLNEFTEPLVIDQIAIDSRRINSPRSLFVALSGKQSDGHEFISSARKLGAKYALVKKEWPCQEFPGLTLLKVANPLKALQEIAAIYRQKLNCKVLAITGSYGKTMVKDLLLSLVSTSKKAAASPESFNSQIGVPLSLFTLSKQDEVAIVEAGISEKGEMEHLAEMIQPNFGLITHLGKKHLSTLGSRRAAAIEMIHLFQRKPLEWLMLPSDPLFKDHLHNNSPPLHFWDIFEPGLPFAEKFEFDQPYSLSFPDGTYFHRDITSGFYYFLDLINMAVKAAWKLGISKEAIIDVLRDYVAEPMRTEIWESEQSVTFINDNYSSDPQSIEQSFHLLKTTSGKGRRIFIFGGLRGSHHSSDYLRVGSTVKNGGVDTLCLYGQQDFKPLIDSIISEAPSTTIFRVNDYEEALQLIKPQLRREDTVLIKGAKKEPFETLLKTYHESLLTNLCLINLAAIEANIKAIRGKLPIETRIMIMVKALAYGTDDLRIAKFLSRCGIDILGVSYVDEAIALRKGHVKQHLFVLNASSHEANKIIAWDLEVGVSDIPFIEHLGKLANEAKKQVKVHLHIDTGMCRFGCRPEDALRLAKAIKSHPFLILEGIMTHFASSDKPSDDAFTLSQAQKLDQAIATLKAEGFSCPWVHAANSGAAIRFNFPQYNMVRIGLAAYGLYPSLAVQEQIDLKLAVSLISRIVGINICKKGETISYGRTYTIEKEEQKIAVLPVGYFDGMHRNYSGKAHVLIRGSKAPMVGKICMDFMMADVTDIPNVSIGDQALIFGEDDYGNYLSPEDLAERGNSIIHELITCLGPRIQRVFIIEESKQHR